MEKKERRLKLSFIGQRWKAMLYFEHFFLIPTLATFDINDYQHGNKWVYVRFFTLYILWWEFSLEWRHGEAKKLFNH